MRGQFEEREQCIADEYSSFVAVKDDKGEVHLNGKLTLGENTADNGGLKLSFMSLAGQPGFKRSEDRRLHAGAEILYRLCAGVVREREPAARTRAGADRSALTGKIPRDRGGAELSAVPQGFRLQDGRCDGSGKGVSRLVRGCWRKPKSRGARRYNYYRLLLFVLSACSWAW